MRSDTRFSRLAARAATVLGLAALLGLCACGNREGEPPLGSDAPQLMDLGAHHRPITTEVPLAQRYFDQGLVLSFGFNHDGGIQAFEAATRLDPQCAMCFWGIALALGPNINAPMGPEAGRKAYAAIQKARALAAGTTPAERDYIEALATRYAEDPPADRAALDRAYADAMKGVHERYPRDLDAATLYAEALMTLNPWNHWSPEGEPLAETPEIVETLESVLERDPDHPGANHFYIHAIEASPEPERGLAAADRLRNVAPGAGHLVHMPSHIYLRVGRYEDALDINRRAARADEEYFAWCRTQGLYRALYYPHNIHFLWSAAATEGRRELAMSSGRKLVSQISPDHLREFPFVEEFLPTPLFTLARFGEWDRILGEPKPAAEHAYTTAIWHYARGLAFTRQGKAEEAAAEQTALDAIAAREALSKLEFAAGTAADNLGIASRHLAGERAALSGEFDTALEALEAAVRLQDGLRYTEPPPWYFPTRQALGAVLLEAGRATEAESVYRNDLDRNPKNGWSLFGLAQSLRHQGKPDDAQLVEAGFAMAWQRADVELGASRF